MARLATADAAGRPHVVPVTFALDGETAYTAVDHKPKRTTALKRLANVRARPDVSLLVDHYDEDWDCLWWVRLDGCARVVDDGPEHDRGVELLVAKYEQYRARPPAGPVILIEVTGRRTWDASRG